MLKDLNEAIDSVQLEKMGGRTRQIIEELSSFLEPYLLGTKVMRTPKDIEALKNDLKGETRTYALIMEERAYECNTSRLRQDLLSLSADFAAAGCKAFTFGMIPAAQIVEHIRGWEYQRHARKLLYHER